MKRYINKLVVAGVLCTAASTATAGGSAEASAEALNHSLQAVAYSMEAGVKLAFGAAAVPFTLAGEIGNASGQVGEDLWEVANSPPSGVLPISDEVVTVGPRPAEQLNGQEKTR